jgi:hypothetical protein
LSNALDMQQERRQELRSFHSDKMQKLLMQKLTHQPYILFGLVLCCSSSHCCCCWCCVQAIVSQLLSAGANPNATNSAGSSPLLEAAMNGSRGIQVRPHS